MNLAQSLLTALQDHGVREIFGNPGDFALAFFKVIEASGISPLYTLSHEPAVGFAAVRIRDGRRDVWVRTRRLPQAALAQAYETRGKFQLIEILIPPGVLSKTLSNFVAGVKRLQSR